MLFMQWKKVELKVEKIKIEILLCIFPYPSLATLPTLLSKFALIDDV